LGEDKQHLNEINVTTNDDRRHTNEDAYDGVDNRGDDNAIAFPNAAKLGMRRRYTQGMY
jgi:hypothetical protein